KIQEALAWPKTVGGTAQTIYRGDDRVRSRYITTMAANNLAKLPRLLAA
ncbi:MAG: IS5/IS1182 family transposase, partial [Paracoccaceae bacterium]